MEREFVTRSGFRIERDLEYYPDGDRYTISDGFALLTMHEKDAKLVAQLLLEVTPFDVDQLKELKEIVELRLEQENG